MWYDQIASAADRSGAEYGVDFKFLKWIGKREAKEPSLITKVQRVEEALIATKRVGQFPNFLEFVSGTASMRWGTVRGLACFVTETPNLGLLLVGSADHLVGVQPRKASFPATSFDVPGILKELSTQYPGDALKPIPSVADRSAADQLDPIAVTIAAFVSPNAFVAPAQRLQFIAKTLLHGKARDRYVLYASPLYVALAE